LVLGKVNVVQVSLKPIAGVLLVAAILVGVSWATSGTGLHSFVVSVLTLWMIVVFFVVTATAMSAAVGRGRWRKAGVFLEHDTSVVRRVIEDAETREEVIVVGKHRTTFRDALRRDWRFTRIGRSDSWLVLDRHGNDITDAALGSHPDRAVIVLRDRSS